MLPAADDSSQDAPGVELAMAALGDLSAGADVERSSWDFCVRRVRLSGSPEPVQPAD